MDAMPPPEDMNWDPTSGMTSEERIGYEMVRTLEGQLVTDDTFKAHTRALDRTFKNLRRQLRLTRIVAGIAVSLVAVVSTWAWHASQDAKKAAKETEQVATCNEFRLDAIAERKISPLAARFGCDMTLAQTLINRSVANSDHIDQLEQRIAELEKK